MEKIFQLETNEIDSLLAEIRENIFTLKKMNIPEDRIKISMTVFFKNFIEHYCRHLNYNMDFKFLFGVEIVKGYNNQICVFDEFAGPNDKFLEPIIIKMK